MKIINSSPLIAATYFLMDKEGAEVMLLVLKGTWRIEGGGKLSVADGQMPIISEPIYRGEPDKSSLIYDTDVVLEKPGTDCVLIGHARALKPRLAYVDVTFGVGPVKKHARVFGERQWEKSMLGESIVKIRPIEEIPLIWENAFGGSDTSWKDSSKHEFCLENPVGRGFLAKKTVINIDGQRLPNIEDPADLIKNPKQHPKPIGFGMIAPYWQPRASYAGMYDERWRKYISPLLPDDFDTRFNLSAAPPLSTKTHLKGNERVLVEGASKHGRLLFDLPGITPKVKARRRGYEGDLPMRLDTIFVEPDNERIILTWRGVWNIHGKVHQLISVRIET
ncbi:MAG: DUF2169 domain-containing protein [Deltaproteobacteria bacterium HGW-Deltaproteobacteria-1]|jgi:hypothetical protein|nr:MAG: DUF2169 domain-containing protein [Deltaproteobacteria bacterium HGW-Deltaproteobacteria-1]